MFDNTYTNCRPGVDPPVGSSDVVLRRFQQKLAEESKVSQKLTSWGEPPIVTSLNRFTSAARNSDTMWSFITRILCSTLLRQLLANENSINQRITITMTRHLCLNTFTLSRRITLSRWSVDNDESYLKSFVLICFNCPSLKMCLHMKLASSAKKLGTAAIIF